MPSIYQRRWLDSGNAASVETRQVNYATASWLEDAGFCPELVCIAERQAGINMAKRWAWLPFPSLRKLAL